MKDALFHLPNERLEGLESFALVFLFTRLFILFIVS